MIRKFIFICVRYRIRIFSKLFHTARILVEILKSGCNLYYRSPILFHWAKTYIPYIRSKEWVSLLHMYLDNKDKIFIDDILDKIEYIEQHNIVDYRKLYTHADELEQQNYLKYFYRQPKSNYFKQNGYGLMNEYCIQRDVKRFGIVLGGKDILDCGAYIGDSSIAFSDQFSDSKVYAIEASPINIHKLQEVISLYKKSSQIIPINVGVGDKDKKGYISDEGIGSRISTTGVSIQIRSIDSLVDEYNLNPGLIKRDIEGFEYESLLGTIETIKKYKPILLISVYHNGKDLFEAKKLLQELDVGYRFTFTRWDSMTPFSDTLLVCY